MSRMLSLFGAALCVAVVQQAGLSRCQGADPAAVQSAAEKKIEDALATPTELAFQEAPLKDVVDYLSNHHDITIVLDRRALSDVGIGEDLPITRNLHGISLRSALELTLDEHDLTYVVEREVLLITTEEEAGCEDHMRTKVYPVADLIDRYIPAPDEEVRGELADFDSLIEMITSTIEPTTWAEVGGPGSTAPVRAGNVESLVILQTYHVHRKIAVLLRQLRDVAEAKRQFDADRQRSTATACWPRSAAAEKIEKALDSPTCLECTEAPLEEVVEQLKQLHKIEIQIDSRALGDVGLGVDTPITKSLKGISLRAALRLVLGELDLTCIVENEVLMITTEEEACAEKHMSTRLYPAADLATLRNPPGSKVTDLNALADLITSTIQPTTWDEVGGPGCVEPISLGGVPTLVVSQTQDVHDEIAALLAQCRKVVVGGVDERVIGRCDHLETLRFGAFE